ncbi:MAG: hypothetical protein ACOC1G_08330, partial [Phycisphaeraceae bacterium]
MKEVTPLQQNIEKIVIAAAALLLLLTLAYFYVLQPFAIEYGGREVAPIEFEQQLEDSVQQLDRKLQTAEVPDRRIADYAEVFTRTFNDTIRVSNEALAILMLPGLDFAQDAGETEMEFALPSPPVVRDMRARSGFASLDLVTLDEEYQDARQALLNLIDNPDPPDFRYVSVAGTFDFEQWNEQLERTDIFPGWLRDKRGIGRVFLLRQARNPETGEWGETRRIDPLPTQEYYGTETSYTPTMAEDVLTAIREGQQDIARPDLPPARRIDGGRTWFSPDLQASLSIDQRLRFDEINATIASNEKRIEALANRMDLDDIPAPPRVEPEFDGEFRPPDMRDDSRREAPSGRAPRDFDRRGDNADRRESDPMFAELRELQRENVRLERERRDILEDAGADAQALFPTRDLPGQDPERDPEQDPERDAEQEPSQEEQDWLDQEVRIWAHDITVEPGRTYRYKLVASVVNPLFAETNLVPEQREANRDRLLLQPDEQAIEEMPWADPVDVDPVLQFFLVNGNVNLGMAEIEVWRPYNGRWVVGEFSLRPGDRIGGEGQTAGGATIDLTLD